MFSRVGRVNLIKQPINIEKSPAPVMVYYRLIALWAICEAFGGGILHAFKVPFTGMFINSMAVLCISLIGFHYRKPRAIFKATIIVCIFKLMLSPHSPPTAYIAVMFQGFLGQLLFTGTSQFTIRTIILAVLSLVESSIQRLLVLVIVYGNSFWEAVDTYLSRLFEKEVDYIELLAVLYISVHALAGIIAGWYAAKLARIRMDQSLLLPPYLGGSDHPVMPRRKKRIKLLFYIIWAFVIFLYIDSLARPGSSAVTLHRSVMIMVRACAIILSWWLFLSPLIKRLLENIMENQQRKNIHVVQAVNSLLPEVLYIFRESWKRSSGRFPAKAANFFKIVVTNVLYQKHPRS